LFSSVGRFLSLAIQLNNFTQSKFRGGKK